MTARLSIEHASSVHVLNMISHERLRATRPASRTLGISVKRNQNRLIAGFRVCAVIAR